MLSKFENWKRTRNGPPMGWGGVGGVTAADVKGMLWPRWPPFDPEFDVI